MEIILTISQKWKIELPYNPAILLLDIYPRDNKKNLCPLNTMFIVAIHSSYS